MENIQIEGNTGTAKFDRVAESEEFIRENYPFRESAFTAEELLDNCVDGFERIEKRDERNGELIGLATYNYDQDHEDRKYCRLGLFVVCPAERGEGLGREMMKEIIAKAKSDGCQYVTAKADTAAGESLMTSGGFYTDVDPVNGGEYYRFDIEG